MILIVSHEKDAHSREVARVLHKKKHEAYLLDLSRFPVHAQLTMSYQGDSYLNSYWDEKDKNFEFDACGAVWWRRPQPFELHPEMKGQTERGFAFNECHCAISGLWLLPNAGWINNPVNDEVASRKAYQLKVATEVGLVIPKTCITNSPKRAMDFIKSFGKSDVICKSFSATEEAWRETRIVKEEELKKLDNVKFAPVIFQECIHAEFDLRITVIGNHIFPAAIYSQDTAYKVDYRMNYHVAKIVSHPLPEALNRKLLEFMKRVGLVYGAIDMRRTKSGEYIFLEVNPAGQWLFMEQPTGMPITEALADALIAYDKQHVLNTSKRQQNRVRKLKPINRKRKREVQM